MIQQRLAYLLRCVCVCVCVKGRPFLLPHPTRHPRAQLLQEDFVTIAIPIAHLF